MGRRLDPGGGQELGSALLLLGCQAVAIVAR
jgi:hypothetical protein